MPIQPIRTDADAGALKLDPNKPTVLIVSDSAAIHSGFAQVVRNVFRRLWRLKEWNIVQFGWWHTMPQEKVPWPIITTNRHPADPNQVDPNDKYGEMSLDRVIGMVKPDIVWVMGDPWMVAPALVNPHRQSYHCILYIPVDGAPLMKSWEMITDADTIVPYLPWGEQMIKRWVPKAIPKLVSPIPHGVDIDTYKPNDVEAHAKVRSVAGLKPDDIVMLSVSRNQARKNLPALVEMTYYIRSGDYQVCSLCGRVYRNPFDYSHGQPSGMKAMCKNPGCWMEYADGGHPKMVPGVPHPNFYYYMHTPVNDVAQLSWRITDILDAFRLGVVTSNEVRYPGFRWNEHLQPVHGMDEGELSTLYAGVDIFALPTVGEGFGLPILEAMSCGVPVVVPNVSSHPDFVREGGGMLVDIGYNICEIHSSYYRGYPDLDDYLTKLLLLVEDKGLRKTLGSAGRATAMKYNWDKIAEDWRVLINNRIGDTRATKRWQRLTTV